MGLAEAFIAEALNKAMKSGGEAFIESLAESLTTQQLESLQKALTRILDKRKSTIDAKAG